MNKQNLLVIFVSLIILFSFSLTTYYLLLTTKNPSSSSSPKTLQVSPTIALSIPELTLDSIFISDHAWIKQLPTEQTFTLITTGDVIPARSVNYKMTIYNDFTHPFLKTAS